MIVREKIRSGKHRWVIEIPHRDRRTGKRVRYRGDAQVQTSQAAHAEERRVVAQLEELGRIPTGPEPRAGAALSAPPAPVVLSSKGTVGGESSLLHAFQRVLAEAKLPKSRLHDLRH